MVIDKHTLGKELKRWFAASVILHDTIDFKDEAVFEEALTVFITDYNRYYENSKEITQENVLTRTELVGILLYRIARIYFLKQNEVIAQKYSLLGRFLSGFEIYYSAEIGKSLKINHGLGTVIGARVTIGDNALLHQNVTFGDRKGGRPQLKNNVTVYAGAKVLGKITIGNNSVLAANSVCLSDVPDNSTVAGIPARIINSKTN
jgi:serine O-acetyltransferase